MAYTYKTSGPGDTPRTLGYIVGVSMYVQDSCSFVPIDDQAIQQSLKRHVCVNAICVNQTISAASIPSDLHLAALEFIFLEMALRAVQTLSKQNQ